MANRRDELLERSGALPELRSRAERHPMALKAQGSRIYDVDNHGFVDYTAAGGAAIVGYANQFLLDAVRKVLATGVPEGLHGPQEVELAESLEQLLPWVGTWFFFRNQDEALALALRWVRRFTGKSQVLLLDGGSRWLFDDSGSVADEATSTVREVPGWQLDRVEAALTAGGSRIGALVVDPLMSRFGVVPPPDGTLARIAEVCRANGVILVYNEVVTGFRVARGGAAAWSGVTPDVAVYGGALGGGFPIGAVGFRSGLDAGGMTADGPLPVPHPVSLAAADAVLSILKNDTVYARLEERSDQLVKGVLALAERFSRPMVVNRVGSVFSMYMTREPVVDRASWQQADPAAYRRLVEALQREGVLLPPEPSAPAFVSSAHGAKDIEETLAACERVLLRLYQEDMP